MQSIPVPCTTPKQSNPWLTGLGLLGICIVGVLLVILAGGLVKSIARSAVRLIDASDEYHRRLPYVDTCGTRYATTNPTTMSDGSVGLHIPLCRFTKATRVNRICLTLEYSLIQDTVPETHTYDTGLFLVRGGIPDDTTLDKTIYKSFYQLPDGTPDIEIPEIKPTIKPVVIQSKPIDILP